MDDHFYENIYHTYSHEVRYHLTFVHQHNFKTKNIDWKNDDT